MDKSIKKCNGKLNFFYGNSAEDVIRDIIKNNNILSITFVKDYTKFSNNRDNNIQDMCIANNIECNIIDDITLYDINKITTKSGNPYKKFKWFYKSTQSMNVPKPSDKSKLIKFTAINIASKYNSKYELIKTKYNYNKFNFVKGGRENALKTMKNNIKHLHNYNEIRQYPILNKNTSSYLSAYNKFGCLSIRELYYHILDTLEDNGLGLIRQIVWRDFYYNLAYFYPDTFEGNKNSIVFDYPWKYDLNIFRKWCQGKTGFPFIDAGMRQLNKEGYMNNRVRLCCASFLVRNLHIDWRWGERYFAEKLVDYDPCQNNGNWQWISSTGYESQAYYRYLNPNKDLLKYDPEFKYVKKYIYELKDEANNNIKKGIYSKNCNYPKKMLDIKITFSKFKDNVKKLYEN